MNNEFNLNTRTLIVSFVLALAVMVPLRFVEVGNLSVASQSSVLGDSIEAPVPRIEAPYDIVDMNSDCLSNEYVDGVIVYLTKTSDIESFNSRRCR
ncbi:MAG: hypothetical protein WC069_00090 [Candidatus Shapirobacteria bacterium]